MGQQINPALTALSLVLDDATKVSGTPAEDILVERMELRARTDDPSPLPPAFFITLGNGLEYIADTQGNITQSGEPGDGLTDRELRVRFTQIGGFGGWTRTYEADDSTLSREEAEQLRQHIADSNFFELPDEVGNGDPLPDMYSYTVWIAHGRRNRELTTYDGSGPHESPPLERLIEWLKERAPRPELLGGTT